MEKKELSLNFIWNLRLGFRAEAGKLREEAGKLYAEGGKRRAEAGKLWAEGSKRWAEASKLYAEADKLWAEGDRIWAEAILEVYGNIKIEWTNYNSEKQDYECHLETGEIFKP